MIDYASSRARTAAATVGRSVRQPARRHGHRIVLLPLGGASEYRVMRHGRASCSRTNILSKGQAPGEGGSWAVRLRGGVTIDQ